MGVIPSRITFNVPLLLSRSAPRVGSRAPGHYYHGYYRPEPKEGKEQTKARSSLAIHSEGGWGALFERS
ncbi:unnamed protein product [Lupinus luteus]|uniref:Uncharacterized protein n=1 Tax=Lupinus luteus TaxID=3873 RepID=A0AAV1W7A4_LUPLU